MSEPKLFSISSTDFQQKRYEIARDLLSSVITFEKLNIMTEQKQRESLAFSCIQLSETLLANLGYVVDTADVEGSKIKSIADLMKVVNKE